MSETIEAIYEQGVLYLAEPLSLPEHSKVQVQVLKPISDSQSEHQQIKQALLEAGLIRPRQISETVTPVSDDALLKAAQSLAKAGPISEAIIADRDNR